MMIDRQPLGHYKALVLAGGLASRMNSARPKSLLRIGFSSILYYTLNELIAAKATPILVVTDRDEWVEETNRCILGFSNVHLLRSRQTDSTFEVALDHQPMLADRFFFVYGHAPRPREHYLAMLQYTEGTIATRVSQSTKRNPVPTRQLGFLEPPYLLDRSVLNSLSQDCWPGFFLQPEVHLKEIDIPGPGEFNYPSEFLEYAAFWQCLWRNRSKALSRIQTIYQNISRISAGQRKYQLLQDQFPFMIHSRVG